MESAGGIHFRRGKLRVSRHFADGTRMFIPMSKLVEILISTKGVDFVDTLKQLFLIEQSF